MAGKLASGEGFTLEDFVEQLAMVRKLGPIGNLLGMLPGAAQNREMLSQVSDKDLDRAAAIVNSMTVEERRNPKMINGSRRARIAAGSGVTVGEVEHAHRPVPRGPEDDAPDDGRHAGHAAHRAEGARGKSKKKAKGGRPGGRHGQPGLRPAAARAAPPGFPPGPARGRACRAPFPGCRTGWAEATAWIQAAARIRGPAAEPAARTARRAAEPARPFRQEGQIAPEGRSRAVVNTCGGRAPGRRTAARGP